MTKATNSKYSAAMVAAIVSKSEALKAEGRKLNLEIAAELAALPEFVKAEVTTRGVVAKIRSLGLAYDKQERTDKTGQPVERKEQTAARIAELLNLPFEDVKSLEKAEKAALRIVAAAVERLTADETADA